MTNEAKLLVETHIPISFIVADAAIAKGAICKMSDNMTAALSDGDADVVAGIAKGEKISGDGKLRHGMYRGGIFRVIASGSITVGDALMTAGATGGANYVATAAADSNNLLGIALESVSTGETLRMELNPAANKSS